MNLQAADAVVVGKVAAVGKPDPATFSRSITLQVTESIKGSVKADSELAILQASDIFPDEWTGHSFLFLLQNNAEYKTDSKTLNEQFPLREARSSSTVLQDKVDPNDDATRHLRVFHPGRFITIDLKWIDQPQEILAVARAESKRPNAGAFTDLEVSRRVVEGGDTDFGFVRIPDDDRVDTLALRMIKQPESILTPGDWAGKDEAHCQMMQRDLIYAQNQLRASGITRIKKTPETVELVKSFLNDSSIKSTIHEDKTMHTEYILRKAAYDRLQSWGVDVPKPLLEFITDPQRPQV